MHKKLKISKNKKVLVAMSGGVDSSVAAYLLQKEGFDVTGVTMCFGVKSQNRKKPACCGKENLDDAKKVCDMLGMRHITMDFSKILEKEVIDGFVKDYMNGRTPNPCVECNKNLKFGVLLKKSLALRFDFLATGHYARIEKNKKDYLLKKARDPIKDQSYFLYSIKSDTLKYLIFPLGDIMKTEVREIAKKVGLPVADKPQSQDRCFIPYKNYHTFLVERIKSRIEKGPIFDLKEKVLGQHRGAAFYTIGQRGGLGIGYKHALYVVAVDTKKNHLIVGEKKDLRMRGLLAEHLNMLTKKIPKKAHAKIRYNHKEARCQVIVKNSRMRIIFDEPQEAITPGQSAVLYNRDIVLGGGIIEKALRLK